MVRYRDARIIWILGGDRVIETDAQREVIRAIAEGLRAGDDGAHLISYHPSGGKHSADLVHDEPWLDFNTIQSGHGEKNIANYHMLALDYSRAPAKPCTSPDAANAAEGLVIAAAKACSKCWNSRLACAI